MQETGAEGRPKADLILGVVVLLFAGVAVAVLRQPDVELILPRPGFEAGFKDGVPGGFFIVPLARFQFPLELFYALGPVLLLVLHASVLLRPALLRAATPVLRLAALWLPFLVLALIGWRFAPYVASRPVPPLAGALMQNLQIVVLAADLAFVAMATALVAPAPDGPRGVNRALRLLQAGGVAAAVWLIAFLAWHPAQAFFDTAEMNAMGAALLLVAVFFVIGLIARTEFRRLPPSPAIKENLTMRDRFVLLAAFLVGALAPAYGRAVDLSGARLVPREPNEAIRATAKGDATGIDLSSWRLRRGNFEHATMVQIRMAGADLGRASFDHADLTGADLSGATLTGVRFSDASLRGASLRNATQGDAVLSGGLGGSGEIVLAQQDAQAAKPPARMDAADRLDLTGADLTGAHLDGANLSNAILKDAILRGADLSGTLLCGADLRNVDLTGAKNIGSAIFNGADLAGATLPADLSGGHLRNANLFHAKIENAPARNWTGVIGSGIREIDSLSGSPSRDAAIAVTLGTVADLDGGKHAEPCSEPPPAKP